MFGFIIGAVGGLVVGWFLLPAPKAVQDWWKRRFGKVTYDGGD